jgi:hypothetical protein
MSHIKTHVNENQAQEEKALHQKSFEFDRDFRENQFNSFQDIMNTSNKKQNESKNVFPMINQKGIQLNYIINDEYNTKING